MSRKRPTPIFDDPVQQRIVQLRTLLGLIEAAPKAEISDEALRAAGFATDQRPVDPFSGRRALAWIQEREGRRKLRDRGPSGG